MIYTSQTSDFQIPRSTISSYKNIYVKEELGLHNQMMIYLFDDGGNLLIEKAFGTA